MKLSIIAAIASLAHMASAVGVVGKAEGFAYGVTGGEFGLYFGGGDEPYANDKFAKVAVLLLSTPRTSRNLLPC